MKIELLQGGPAQKPSGAARKDKVPVKKQNIFASSQMIVFHPVLEENIHIRTQYFKYLRKLIRDVKWDKRKYTKAQIAFYKDKLCEGQKISKFDKNIDLISGFCYLIPFDLAIMLGFHKKLVHTDKSTDIIDNIVSDFNLPWEAAAFLEKELEAALGDETAWKDVVRHKGVKRYLQYLNLVKENILFIKKPPYNILITATMSAGKSTIINALAGKDISLMQTTACTSKIHAIISKPFEDGVISEHDYNMFINASTEELLEDNENNRSSKITVSTYFNSTLGGQRMILFDSPGVNSSEHPEHTRICQDMIRSGKYRLMIYVLNATQLATMDEEQHLETVAKNLGRAKILFVLNKTDQPISREENIFEMIERQRKFLSAKGFRNPVICPVSAYAAYLVKKSRSDGLSWLEQREMDNYMYKYERHSLAEYYEKQLHCAPMDSSEDETQMLFQNCGFAYFEKIIEHLLWLCLS